MPPDRPDRDDPADDPAYGCRWRAPLPVAGHAATSRAALGRAGEDAALAHLVAVHGLDPVARNRRVAVDGLRGELDLVLRDPRSGVLVVCEVKVRRGAGRLGGAVAALGPQQSVRIRRLTGALLATTGLRATAVRLDLVAVDVPHGAGPAALTHLHAAW
jgi:Holliday junction resolvase-like predicted endonuclease